MDSCHYVTPVTPLRLQCRDGGGACVALRQDATPTATGALSSLDEKRCANQLAICSLPPSLLSRPPFETFSALESGLGSKMTWNARGLEVQDRGQPVVRLHTLHTYPLPPFLSLSVSVTCRSARSNYLGWVVQLMGEHVLIKDMRPGMRNITCTFIVLEKGWSVLDQSPGVESLCRVYSFSFRH